MFSNILYCEEWNFIELFDECAIQNSAAAPVRAKISQISTTFLYWKAVSHSRFRVLWTEAIDKSNIVVAPT